MSILTGKDVVIILTDVCEEESGVNYKHHKYDEMCDKVEELVDELYQKVYDYAESLKTAEETK